MITCKINNVCSTGNFVNAQLVIEFQN